MTIPAESHDFDWVTARHECSLGAMFTRLRRGAEKDIELRNGLRQKGEPSKWVVEGRGDQFIVYRESQLGYKSVEFDRRQSSIDIHSPELDFSVSATLTLADSGECKLVVDGQQLYEWQLRKRVLERLLF
jgi:hypothetical protein